MKSLYIKIPLLAAIFICLILPLTLSVAITSFSTDNATTFSKDRVIVVFKNGVTSSRTKAVVKSKKGEKAGETKIMGHKIAQTVTVPRGQTVNETVKSYEKDPAVAYAQPNYMYISRSQATPQYHKRQKETRWNLSKINTKKTWNLIDRLKPAGGEKVKVAVLDSGVFAEHEDLQASLDKEHSVDIQKSVESGIVSEAAYPRITKDHGGHGTMVTGVIGATYKNGKGTTGVATGNKNNIVSIMVLDVYKTVNASSRVTTSFDLISGIQYAQNHDAKVINMSLGHSPEKHSNDQALEDAIKHAYNNGILTVCSAGNDNSSSDWYPSDFDSVISVMSTDNYSNAFSICKSSFSNYGAAKDISAPGRDIYSTAANGGYRTSSGTSFAAAEVTGTAAMMLYVNPRLSPSNIKSIMYSTASDLFLNGYDIYTGHGNIDAFAAVAKAASVKIKTKTKLSAPVLALRHNNRKSLWISWKKVRHANGYYIYRSLSKKGGYRRVRTIYDKNTFSYVDSGLKSNKKYYYKIKAFGTKNNKKAFSSFSLSQTKKPDRDYPRSGFESDIKKRR